MSDPSLRLVDGLTGEEGHSGEIYTVGYSSDSAFVLSGGWDGHLRLWESNGGSQVSFLQVGHKPLSACAFAPDNRSWLAGSMEGVLSSYDAASHECRLTFLAHTRPISSIRFSPDGQHVVTTSWDKQVALRKVGKEREARVLAGHGDIAAGSAFTPNGKNLLSWAYDGSVLFWEIGFQQPAWTPGRHHDRVQGASISPDGKWAVTGSRDGVLKLWDLVNRVEAGQLAVNGEIRGCWFLLDGESIVAVTADGWLAILAIPTFEVRAELLTDLRVECGEVAPSGNQLALGCGDGLVHFVAVDGLEQACLTVTATQAVQEQATVLGRLLGKKRITKSYLFACPVCHHAMETPQVPALPIPCPQCRRPLRVNPQTLVQQR